MSDTTNTADQTSPVTVDCELSIGMPASDAENAVVVPLDTEIKKDSEEQQFSSCKQCCCEEFKRKNWGLEYETPDLFVFNQWTQRPSVVFVVYRQVASLFFCTVLVYSIAVFDGPRGKYFIYLTHWTFTILCITETLKTSLAYTGYARTCRMDAVPVYVYADMTVLMKVCWVFNNVSATMAPVITVVYWVAVYGGWQLDIRSITSHALNTTYVVIDWCLTGLPARFLHWYQPLSYVAIYGIFTIIYWAAEGTSEDGNSYIYSIIDYDKSPTKAIGWIFAVFVSVLAVHAGHFGIVKLRQYIYSRNKNTSRR